jgi:TRAP-type C4-dicarboxylate transport system substrate-binding protein
LAATAFGAAGIANAQTKLKWAHVYETSEPFHKYSVWAAEEIKKRTNGKYDIQVFPASSLGKEADINQGLTLGTVDIVLTGASFAGRTYKPLAISYFPVHLPRRRAPAEVRQERRVQGTRQGLRREERQPHHRAQLLRRAPRHVERRAPCRQARRHEGPEDPRARRAGLPGLPKALGANATPIAFAEVYLALQNGTVDAQENPLPTIEAKKFFEVQKNISLTGHIVDSLLTVVSGQLWGKLSADEKKIFTEVMQEAADKTGREIIASEARLTEEFKKKGNNVITVDKAAFREAVLKNTKPTDHGYRQADYDDHRDQVHSLSPSPSGRGLMRAPRRRIWRMAGSSASALSRRS